MTIRSEVRRAGTCIALSSYINLYDDHTMRRDRAQYLAWYRPGVWPALGIFTFGRIGAEISATKKISSIHVNEVVLVACTWVSSSPTHMNGTVTEISATNWRMWIPIYFVSYNKTPLEMNGGLRFHIEPKQVFFSCWIQYQYDRKKDWLAQRYSLLLIDT